MRLEPENPRPASALGRSVLWTGAGALLAALSFVVLHLVRSRLSAPLWIGAFLLLLAGLTALYWNANTLRNDIRNERWSEDELKPYRDFFQSGTMTALNIACLILLAVASLMDRKFRFIFWPIMVFSNLLSQLAMAFRKPVTRTPAGHLDWTGIHPIRSEHWGER